MGRKISGAIPWAGSKARELLLTDIEEGILPDSLTASEAWTEYEKLDEFAKVPYKQFEERLTAHRKQVHIKKEKSLDDLARLLNTKLTLAPTKTFLGSEKHRLLREDVKAEIESGLKPASTKEFQARRPEYLQLTTTFFGKRLRQERRYRKFCMYLEEKRLKNMSKELRTAEERKPFESEEQEEYNNEVDNDCRPSGKSRKKKKTS